MNFNIVCDNCQLQCYVWVVWVTLCVKTASHQSTSSVQPPTECNWTQKTMSSNCYWLFSSEYWRDVTSGPLRRSHACSRQRLKPSTRLSPVWQHLAWSLSRFLFLATSSFLSLPQPWCTAADTNASIWRRRSAPCTRLESLFLAMVQSSCETSDPVTTSPVGTDLRTVYFRKWVGGFVFPAVVTGNRTHSDQITSVQEKAIIVQNVIDRGTIHLITHQCSIKMIPKLFLSWKSCFKFLF